MVGQGDGRSTITMVRGVGMGVPGLDAKSGRGKVIMECVGRLQHDQHSLGSIGAANGLDGDSWSWPLGEAL
eukprot:361569-Chlamydomonas_euryale.AAC.9